MTLLSDSSMNMFPSNIQSEFTVKLDHPIEIDEESWEVALAEIATPSEVLNITEDNNFFFLAFPVQHSLYTKFGVENITEMCSNENGDCYKFKLKISTGNYMLPEYLVEEMQASTSLVVQGRLELSARKKCTSRYPDCLQVQKVYPECFQKKCTQRFAEKVYPGCHPILLMCFFVKNAAGMQKCDSSITINPHQLP